MVPIIPPVLTGNLRRPVLLGTTTGPGTHLSGPHCVFLVFFGFNMLWSGIRWSLLALGSAFVQHLCVVRRHAKRVINESSTSHGFFAPSGCSAGGYEVTAANTRLVPQLYDRILEKNE